MLTNKKTPNRPIIASHRVRSFRVLTWAIDKLFEPDKLVINSSLSDTTFQSATTRDYCHYLAVDISDTVSRDVTTCITNGMNAMVDFSLDTTGENLAIQNNSQTDISLTTTIDQVGDNAGTNTTTEKLAAGQTTTITADGGRNTYLPILIK